MIVDNRFRALAILASLAACIPAQAQNVVPRLPAPTSDPLRIDPAADPILQLARSHASREEFRAAVAAAVARHPATREKRALTEEVQAVVGEARERRLPSIDLNVSSYHVIAREFSNDPQNIIERSRADQRTDARLSVQHTLFDFGAGASRVAAAGARLLGNAKLAEELRPVVETNVRYQGEGSVLTQDGSAIELILRQCPEEASPERDDMPAPARGAIGTVNGLGFEHPGAGAVWIGPITKLQNPASAVIASAAARRQAPRKGGPL